MLSPEEMQWVTTTHNVIYITEHNHLRISISVYKTEVINLTKAANFVATGKPALLDPKSNEHVILYYNYFVIS